MYAIYYTNNFTFDNKLVQTARLFGETLDFMMTNSGKLIGCNSINIMTRSKEAIIKCTVGSIWLVASSI